MKSSVANTRPIAFALVFALFSYATTTHAQSDAGAPANNSIHGCVETIPSGSHRPELRESFPSRGKSGYVATLTVKVNHGKGETVLPQGLDLANESEAKRLLKEAGFTLPDQDGGAGARLVDAPADPAHPDRVTTILELPLVPLPEKPGRNVLVLPPLPVAVARANGGIVTACTEVHSITVEDPIASTPDPKPKRNPPPEKQREEWIALEFALEVLAAVVIGALLLAYVFYRWSKIPRPVPPPPPPRPAWEVALESLDEIRHAGLLDQKRYDEYFDRVSDTIRHYLGDRYDFDGLESTTDEVLAALRKAAPSAGIYTEIDAFCKECDLVKFANMTPDLDDCSRALDAGEQIVRKTMVALPPPPKPVIEPIPSPFAQKEGSQNDPPDEPPEVQP